jgi:hypothetical protein
VAQQVVGGYVRLGAVEEPQDRHARLRGACQRLAVLPQGGVRVHGLDRGDSVELAAPLVQDEADAEERLEPAPEARLRTPDTLGHRSDPPALARVEMQDAIGLSVADGAQDDGFGLERAGHD